MDAKAMTTTTSTSATTNNEDAQEAEEEAWRIDFKQAHCVACKNAVTFLEAAADAFALNAREATDFITFFLPAMQMQPALYCIVQFNPAAYLRRISIDTVPAAATLLRCFMLRQFSSVDLTPLCGAPAFTQLKRARHGLVVTEWGGCTLKSTKAGKKQHELHVL
jgi:hypothetical protein